MRMNSVKIENLTKSYGENKIFENFNLDIKSSQIVEVRGKSGVGKSTLFRCISGLEEFDGNIEVNGEVAMKFQNARMIPWLNVEENILLPFKLQQKTVKSKHYEKISELSEKLELEKHLIKDSLKLSGGQRQRASIIRTLMQNPDVLILDEPFASLDESTLQKVKKQIINFSKQENAIVLYSTQSQTNFSFPDQNININKNN